MRKTVIALFCIILIIMMSGCDKGTTHNNEQGTNSVIYEKLPFHSKEESIEWMTMTGGLGGITTKVIFPGVDDTVINRIVGMINRNIEMFSMDNNFFEDIISKVRPIGLILSFENGSRYYLWPSYEVVHHADDWTVTTLTDRFTLQIQDNGNSSYYTIFSEEMADYLLNGWKDDMPEVEDIRIESDNGIPSNSDFIIRNGNLVKISGDGCPYSKVDIFIRENGSDKSIFIDTVKTDYGHWEWEGHVKDNIKVNEEEFHLEKGLYDIVVNLGEREKAICGIIRID